MLGAIVWWVWASTVQAHELPEFSERERAWIAANPVVRIAAEPNFAPVEFMEKGVYKGVSAGYLDAIAQHTGLRFEVVSDEGWIVGQELMAQGKVDLLPVIASDDIYGPAFPAMSFSRPYMTIDVVAITRKNSPVIFRAQQLQGKTIVVKSGSRVENLLRASYPDVQLLSVTTPQEALEAVDQGQAYAAVGLSDNLLPVMQRDYDKTLAVAGVLTEFSGTFVMGVRQEQTELYALINKSLESLTADETDLIDKRWIETLYYKKPGYRGALDNYLPEIILGGLVLLLLLTLAYRERLLKRRAILSEVEKSKFLAVMSHEIRTPMNAIFSSLELLERKSLPAEHAQLVKLATGGARNLLRLLDDVLDYCKLEAKKVSIELRPTNLKTLLEQVIDMAQLSCTHKPVKIDLRVHSQGGFNVLIDSARLHQVASNLVSNAVKFTEAGHIDVDLLLQFNAGSEQHGTLKFIVTDTGVGIAEDRQEELFSPFTQVGPMSTSRVVGTGLGLTICKELVGLMGGSISLKSFAGVGTRIDVDLPIEFIDAQLVREEYQGVGRTDGLSAALNILVVDDHPDNLAVIERQLMDLGYSSVLVDTGQKALDSWRDNHFDLILLDCQLPDIDGYTVARHIREHEFKDGGFTPIIAISALHGGSHQQACTEAGIDGVLAKPIRLKQLAEMIESWCADMLPGESLHSDDKTLSIVNSIEPSAQAELHDRFLLTTEEDLQALKFAIGVRDWPAVNSLAHRINGASLMLGLHRISVLAAQMERSTEDYVIVDSNEMEILLNKLSVAVSIVSNK